jgi:hypothetical protein
MYCYFDSNDWPQRIEDCEYSQLPEDASEFRLVVYAQTLWYSVEVTKTLVGDERR